MSHIIAPEPSAPQVTVGEQVRNSAEAEVLRLLRGIRFGQLTILVHDARIVQIERTTKIRFDAHAPST